MRWKLDLLVLASRFLIVVEQQLAVNLLLVRVSIRELAEPMLGQVFRSVVSRLLFVMRWKLDSLVLAYWFLIVVGQQWVVSLLLVRI